MGMGGELEGNKAAGWTPPSRIKSNHHRARNPPDSNPPFIALTPPRETPWFKKQRVLCGGMGGERDRFPRRWSSRKPRTGVGPPGEEDRLPPVQVHPCRGDSPFLSLFSCLAPEVPPPPGEKYRKQREGGTDAVEMKSPLGDRILGRVTHGGFIIWARKP